MPRQVLHERSHARSRAPEAHSYMGMKDLPWKRYLQGEHAAAVKEAYEKEIKSLLNTVLRELKLGDSVWNIAVNSRH